MDYTHTAQHLHRQRTEELARVNELRRRSTERDALLADTAAPAVAGPAGRWHRTLIRWRLAPRLAH